MRTRGAKREHVIGTLPRRVARAVVCAGLIAAALPGLAGASGTNASDTWTPTPPTVGRFFAAATLLQNGNVLVAGGDQNVFTPITSVQIYDPATNTWASAAPLGTARTAPVAVTLQSGKVLVAGGSIGGGNDGSSTAEVYDPAGNTWTPTTGAMGAGHGEIAAGALLPSGKVLIAGGTDASGTVQPTAELYNPATDTFQSAASMGVARAEAAVAPLPGGKVLVAGGANAIGSALPSAEVYDPAAGPGGSWTPVANAMSASRILPSAVLLPSGNVLVAGGETNFTGATPTTDIYDPATNRFTAGPPMAVDRAAFTAAPISGAHALAASGLTFASGSGEFDSHTEIYDATTNRWVTTPATVPVPAAGGTTTLLPSGQVLSVGGFNVDSIGAVGLASAALYTPPTLPSAPVDAVATAGNGSASVTFAPPASDGGLPILHYTITSSSGQTATTPDARTNGVVTGLTNGRAVTFTVTATTAFGTSTSSAASAAVTPVAPPGPTPPDVAASLHLQGVPRTMKLKAFLKGVRFSITPSKAAALQLSLLASASRATLARAFNLTLASASLRLSARKQTVTLKPSKKLVGRSRRFTIELVIVATDAAGTRSTTTKTIRVRR